MINRPKRDFLAQSLVASALLILLGFLVFGFIGIMETFK